MEVLREEIILEESQLKGLNRDESEKLRHISISKLTGERVKDGVS